MVHKLFLYFAFILTNIFTEKKKKKNIYNLLTLSKKLNNCNFLEKVKNIKVQDYYSPKIKTKIKSKLLKINIRPINPVISNSMNRKYNQTNSWIHFFIIPK